MAGKFAGAPGPIGEPSASSSGPNSSSNSSANFMGVPKGAGVGAVRDTEPRHGTRSRTGELSSSGELGQMLVTLR